MTQIPTRRRFVLGTAAGLGALAAPAIVHAATAPTRRNTSSFHAQDWRDHFKDLGKAAIVCDTGSRALHFWDATGEDYRIFPTSVPISDDLTKRGYTEITRKKVGPDWTPTQSQRERFGWEYMPPGPDNPLGTHALYLSWPAYLIHGTHDTRKIGRPSSDGCIGLFNEMIAVLYDLTPVGAQVRVI